MIRDLSIPESRHLLYVKRQRPRILNPRRSCALRVSSIFNLQMCSDWSVTTVYCRPCLRNLIVGSIQDKTLFPPRCHRQSVSKNTICSLLPEEQLEDFENTEIEVSCSVKTSCSNVTCGRFIPPAQITADKAYCVRCDTSTCRNCRNEFHEDDSPDDPLLKATLALAIEQKWQRCYACRAVVILAKACNHIT